MPTSGYLRNKQNNFKCREFSLRDVEEKPIPNAQESLKIEQKMKKQQNHFKSSRFARHAYKPAELFRTDFITAMKLPDTESLDDGCYWVIKDQWKLDWEKGVQVPVKDHLNTSNCVPCQDQFELPIELAQAISSNPTAPLPNLTTTGTKIPMPKKYLCPANDKNYRPAIHQAYITHGLAQKPTTGAAAAPSTASGPSSSGEASSSSSSNLASGASPIERSVCQYDCDQMDMAWLRRVNAELDVAGVERIGRLDLERLIENFELQAYENLKSAIDKLQSYSIEYDEDIVCDVCREPDSEENNEMVFCDGCNMCVHQACYGIETIPKGNWLCAPCSYGGSQFRPECVLCPMTSGAMKATKNLRHWAHVSCALWIPETSFGNADKMEPIMNLNGIAPARWQLVCSLCKERRGCCLQCTERRCHAAFHVTCGFKFGLEMKTLMAGASGSDGSDGELTVCPPSGSMLAGSASNQIVFRAYCSKHTKKRAQMRQEGLLEDEGEEEEEEEEGDDEDEDEEDDDEEEADDQDDEDTRSEEVKSEPMETDRPVETASAVSTVHSDEKSFFTSLSKMSENERKLEIIKQIKLLNYEFYKNVNLSLTESQLAIKNPMHLQLVFNYWKLKRRFNVGTITLANSLLMPIQNKPLIVYRSDQDLINRSERMLIAKIREFIRLRQNLEKARNLCCMVSRREKEKKSLFKLKQQIFNKQIEYINRYCSQSDLSMLSSTSSNRGGRLKGILALKSDQCIYDYPELWGLCGDADADVEVNQAPIVVDSDSDDEDSSEREVSSKVKQSSRTASSKTKKKRLSVTRSNNKLAKNIVHKYNMLNYRRRLEKSAQKEDKSGEKREQRESKTAAHLRMKSGQKEKLRIRSGPTTPLKRKSATSRQKTISKKNPPFRLRSRVEPK